MSSPQRYFKTIAVCGVLAAAALGYFIVRTKTDDLPKVDVPVAASVPRANASVPTPSNREVVAAVSESPRPAPAVPGAVRELLPSIEHAVTNWKEFKPQKITIAPYPDMPIEFEVTSIREEHGRTVWTGRNAIQGAFLVSAATEGEWHATLVIPAAGTFEANIMGSSVTMLARDDGNNLCGTQPAMAGPTTAHAVSGDEEMIDAAAAADVATNMVDVLFFYDADTLAAVQGNVSSIDTRLIAYIASSNAALQNSQVTNFQWRYLASYQVPAYTATNDMADDLNVITGVLQNPNGSYRSASNAVSAFVQQKADLHGADQVVLYVGGTRNFAGIAWISPSTLAFHTAVVIWPSSPGSSSSYLTVAHEMGHGFGCHHDRATEGVADSDPNFYYGFRFPDRFGRDTGTIMSYAGQVIPYYSNPAITYTNSAILTTGVVVGVPEGQPKAANNSRVLRESAQAMIDSRPAVDPPAITAQPQSVTVTVGQPFTLSVAASSSNLTYQWKLGGVDIAGASGSSYTKAAAALSDGGSYTVTISNVAGQTTSNAATVTVNAAVGGGSPPVTPQTTPAAPAASEGGGGGGGAVDAWFATGCGLLVMLRCILRKPRS